MPIPAIHSPLCPTGSASRTSFSAQFEQDVKRLRPVILKIFKIGGFERPDDVDECFAELNSRLCSIAEELDYYPCGGEITDFVQKEANKVADAARKKRKRNLAIFSDSLDTADMAQDYRRELADTDESELNEMLLKRDIKAALKALPLRQAQVVHLVVLQQATYSETAVILGITSQTVGSTLSQARHRLRGLLAGYSVDSYS